MGSLLVQACSATKHRVETPVPALELYDGYFFRIIKKALRAGRLRRGLDILIISAKHGVVEPDDQLANYDQRMDTERAAALNNEVVSSIAEKVETNLYEKVWINLGKDYLPAVDGIERIIDVPVVYIDGDGIGMKGKRLKQLVSNRHSTPIHGD